MVVWGEGQVALRGGRTGGSGVVKDLKGERRRGGVGWKTWYRGD